MTAAVVVEEIPRFDVVEHKGHRSEAGDCGGIRSTADIEGP